MRVVANLPYNVAVPIVVRLLEEVPARHLAARHGPVRGRRAARGATRLARLRRGLGQGRLLRAARVVGRVPRSVFLPEPNVDSSLVALERRARGGGRPRRRRAPSGSSRWSGPPSRTGARCCVAPSTGVVDPEAFERGGRRPDPAARGARRRGLRHGWPRARDHRCARPPSSPGRCTSTGVRRRRAAPPRRRDGDPRPRRHGRAHRDRRREPRFVVATEYPATPRDAVARRRRPRPSRPAARRASRARLARQADPDRRRARRRAPPTPPRCCAGRG